MGVSVESLRYATVQLIPLVSAWDSCPAAWAWLDAGTDVIDDW